MKSLQQDWFSNVRNDLLATVAMTVMTHDLAKGVLVGELLSGFFQQGHPQAKHGSADHRRGSCPLHTLFLGSRMADLLRSSTIPTLLLR